MVGSTCEVGEYNLNKGIEGAAFNIKSDLARPNNGVKNHPLGYRKRWRRVFAKEACDTNMSEVIPGKRKFVKESGFDYEENSEDAIKKAKIDNGFIISNTIVKPFWSSLKDEDEFPQTLSTAANWSADRSQ